ncbi:13767_t:CDS:2, partial [Dentiscutata heterogama]
MIIIDEAHDKSVKNTVYQHVPPLLIKMNYKVKWEDEKHLIYFATTKDIYRRTITGKIDYNNKILISGLKPKKRKMLEESSIPFVMFDNTNSDTINSIIQNMPSGSIFLFNLDHEMGISPWARVLISTGKTLEKLLGHSQSNVEKWRRADFVIRNSSLASMIQRIGRVGLPIEVVIIGTTKDAYRKYPIFNMKPDPKKDARLIREEDLVYLHKNELPQPPTINKENQKNIQLIILENRLSSLDLAKQKKKGELIHEEIPPDKVELIKNDVWSMIKK